MMGESNGFRLLSLIVPPVRRGMKGQIGEVNKMEHLREVGEMRLLEVVIQFPSDVRNSGSAGAPLPQMN